MSQNFNRYFYCRYCPVAIRLWAGDVRLSAGVTSAGVGYRPPDSLLMSLFDEVMCDVRDIPAKPISDRAGSGILARGGGAALLLRRPRVGISVVIGTVIGHGWTAASGACTTPSSAPVERHGQ